MASEWFCKVLGREMGPVGFPDLVEMVRSGTLQEDDPVRRKESGDWTAARDVIGLFRAAGREAGEEAAASRGEPETESPGEAQPQAEAEPQAPPGASEPPAAGAGKPPVLWAGKQRPVVVAAACLVAVLVVLAAWAAWSRSDRRFPASRLGKPLGAEEDRLASVLGPRPEVPSVPGLEVQVATPVPGLEDVNPAYSPCLTADLLTIVYAHYAGRKSAYDLYLATRSDVAAPFGPPQPIASSATRETEAYPALSPDGTELVFVRSDKLPRFFFCDRATASGDFGEAAPWPVPGLEPTPQQRLERPYFIDAQRVGFALVSTDGQERSCWTVSRAAPRGEFASREELPVSNVWPGYCVAQSGLRAYFGSPEGLFLCVRSDKNGRFSQGVPLIDDAVTGPIEGTIWVAPQEDVIFYCSPGPGKEPGSARRLWMIRF